MYLYSLFKRFPNGRIYLGTPEVLRPAKITFPGKDNEKAIIESKRNVKLTLEANERKNLKRIDIVYDRITDKRRRISRCGNKREKKIEESDASELEIIKTSLKAENPLTEEEREAGKLTEAIVLDETKFTYFF